MSNRNLEIVEDLICSTMQIRPRSYGKKVAVGGLISLLKKLAASGSSIRLDGGIYRYLDDIIIAASDLKDQLAVAKHSDKMLDVARESAEMFGPDGPAGVVTDAERGAEAVVDPRPEEEREGVAAAERAAFVALVDEAFEADEAEEAAEDAAMAEEGVAAALRAESAALVDKAKSGEGVFYMTKPGHDLGLEEKASGSKGGDA